MKVLTHKETKVPYIYVAQTKHFLRAIPFNSMNFTNQDLTYFSLEFLKDMNELEISDFSLEERRFTRIVDGEEVKTISSYSIVPSKTAPFKIKNKLDEVRKRRQKKEV